MKTELTKYHFEDELKQFAEHCTKLKPSTAKRKARELFLKYEEIIVYSKSREDHLRSELTKTANIARAFKTRNIEYFRQNSTYGVLSLENIEQVDVTKTGVLITTRSGREIKLGKDFEYLTEVI